MANMEDWPVYVLELATKESKPEDISWLLNWILGAFSEYGLLLSSSTPHPDQVNIFLHTFCFKFIPCDTLNVITHSICLRACLFLSPSVPGGCLMWPRNVEWGPSMANCCLTALVVALCKMIHRQTVMNLTNYKTISITMKEKILLRMLDLSSLQLISCGWFVTRSTMSGSTRIDEVSHFEHHLFTSLSARSETKQILQIGNLKMTLFQGQSIGMRMFSLFYLLSSQSSTIWRVAIAVEKLLHKNLISKMYPLHEPESLKRLSHDWLISKPTSLAQQLPLSSLLRFSFWNVLNWFIAFINLTERTYYRRRCSALLRRRSGILLCLPWNVDVGSSSTFVLGTDSHLFPTNPVWSANCLLRPVHGLGVWLDGGDFKFQFFLTVCLWIVLVLLMNDRVGRGAAMDCLSFGAQRTSTAAAKESREPTIEERWWSTP